MRNDEALYRIRANYSRQPATVEQRSFVSMNATIAANVAGNPEG